MGSGGMSSVTGSSRRGPYTDELDEYTTRRMPSSRLDCSKLQIRIFTAADWSGVNPFTCPTAGTLNAGAIVAGDSTPISTTAGTQSSVVLITACYQWTMGKYLPFMHFDNRFSDGSSLIQSSTALKIEPYI